MLPVTRFSIGAVFEMAFISGEILPGAVPVSHPNRYYSATDSAQAFDSSQAYLNGIPSASDSARRYFIAGLLGHTIGAGGNTVAEVLANIDRSVAADGTRPLASGTFYFMNNSADAARNVRQPTFATTVASLGSRGATAAQLLGVLPPTGSNCLGIMSGNAFIDVPGAGITILPGAFCDHLTSYAAAFDIAAQTKVSHWIASGASGSAGCVEEPCNYTGKSLTPVCTSGTSSGSPSASPYLRSLQFVPFQGLFYGDPLTRAYARIPSVSVPDAPTGVVSGSVTLSPAATTTNPARPSTSSTSSWTGPSSRASAAASSSPWIPPRSPTGVTTSASSHATTRSCASRGNGFLP